jgi:hypothetical protein
MVNVLLVRSSQSIKQPRKENAMNVKRYSGPVICLAMLALTGCGGGGSSTTSSTGSTVVTGLASKGPINKGTVKVFAIRNGIEDTAPLNQGQTDATGHYSIDIGTYKGAVMVEVSGSFKDEVSTETTVTLQNPLRAVFSNASTGSNTVAVTPLTELACTKAKRSSALLTKTAIDDANKAMAAKFKLAEIVSTLPIAGGSKAGEKEYAAACGSISQLANTNLTTSAGSGKSLDDSLAEVMSKMESEIENSGDLSDDSTTKLNTAIDDFNSGGKNNSGTEATHVETHGGGGA